MKINFCIALALVASLVNPVLCWAQQENPVTIEARQVRGGIYMLTGQGGNIGLFNGKDGSFMIDDQFAPLTEKIIAAIKSAGGDLPQYLINTHFHGDHTGGNENLGKAGTLIMSHHGVRERLMNGSFIGAFGMKSAPASAAALPTVTYSENIHLHINDETVRIVHVPRAHTDGDSFVIFENANVVHTGDLFFNGFFPFIDGAHGGSVRGVIAGVDAILRNTDNDSKIIPGHGPLAGRADLLVYREMLANAYTRLLKLKNSGKTAEEAVTEKPLQDMEAKWGGGIFTADKWIEVVYPAVF